MLDKVIHTFLFTVSLHERSWGGALRDETKNGCVGDYFTARALFLIFSFAVKLDANLVPRVLGLFAQRASARRDWYDDAIFPVNVGLKLERK